MRAKSLEVHLEAKRLRKTIVIEHPVQQSLILTGQVTGWKGDDQTWAATAATSFLAGGEKSRLFVALRERLGAAYGARATLSELADIRSRTFLQISAYVANDKVADALSTLRKEYGRFITEGITAEELEPFKTKYRSLVPELYQRASGFVMMTRIAMMNGEDGEAVSRMAEKINALTPEGINALIRKHMDEELLTVIVTPSAEGLNADCVVKPFADVVRCEAMLKS